MQYRRRHEVYADEQGSIDLPQGFPDDGPPRKLKVEALQQVPGKRRLRPTDPADSGTTTWIFTFSLLMIVVLAISYFLVSEHERSQIERTKQDILHLQVEPISKEWEEKYAKLQEENERLMSHEKDYQRLKLESQQFLEKEENEQKLRAQQSKQIEYYQTYQTEIHERIQLISHSLLLEK